MYFKRATRLRGFSFVTENADSLNCDKTVRIETSIGVWSNYYGVLPSCVSMVPDGMVNLEIISNEEYKKRKEFRINYAFHRCSFGECLIGLHGSKICHLSFVNESETANLNMLKSQWPHCTLIEERIKTSDEVQRVFNKEETHEVLLKGTEFEGKVWRALLTIPRGKTVSYEEVARMAGRERAVRAAANAVAKNFVSYLVPCHRVIKKDGSLHKYQWGPEIKRKILEFEKSST